MPPLCNLKRMLRSIAIVLRGQNVSLVLLRNTKCLSVAGVWWGFLSAPYPGAIKIFAAVKQRGGGQSHTSVLDKHNTRCQYLQSYEYAAMGFSFGS